VVGKKNQIIFDAFVSIQKIKGLKKRQYSVEKLFYLTSDT